jgi:hypothetical protein
VCHRQELHGKEGGVGRLTGGGKSAASSSSGTVHKVGEKLKSTELTAIPAMRSSREGSRC